MKALHGKALLDDPAQNKSTAFTREERMRYGLQGLLPYSVADIKNQQQRVLGNLRGKRSDIEKYIFLNSLLERNQRLFYRTLIDYIEEIMPLVYTPTVGEACSEFAHIFRKPQGLYITPEDRGRVASLLANWPETDVRIIVVTDGERILGLGDLGANGMGIPIGKIALYVACAGIHPAHCMPVMLDVGTNNQELRNDPLYLGYPHARLAGQDYLSLVDEFVQAVRHKFPDALIQFEDFSSEHAFVLLDRYHKQVRCFNDDIQGTAAVTLAGVHASCRITHKQFADLKIMLLGTGSAATGIARLMLSAFQTAGLSEAVARARIAFVDREGLVVTARAKHKAHIQPFIQEQAPASFLEAIERLQPDVLIGATGAAGAFSEAVIHQMAQYQERPVIIALSNPTSHTECTAEQACRWSDGRAVFASGSPFPAVTMGEKIFHPAQGNNAYIFPGIGLGMLACRATLVTERMFLAAAEVLAAMVSPEEIERGAIYPTLPRVREVSQAIAIAVCHVAQQEGLATANLPDDLEAYVRTLMYEPDY
ncbi:NAD-dependent malic enzyme [Nitrosomonas halophila]|uniref:Malate dehydrogenase (Oxaloacetate-decarboxylating)(NADP+) n=1 Tax=Nitrosomonas halophila TaxID=44576 RepID=A0A1H3I270_9PROT|nr:NAD-dependent malic enzyme [Nitrosomonas halophila]SDY21208.1 malate dehydrogenase (oxaloacetate-decarboxylating)(NADP+) [Nitrosomonas halophila]